MGTIAAWAAGLLLAYSIAKVVRAVPHVWRRLLEASGQFLALVAVVVVVCLELAIVIRPGATFGDIVGIGFVLSCELVGAAWLSLHIAMRLMVVTAEHRQKERERQSYPRSEVV